MQLPEAMQRVVTGTRDCRVLSDLQNRQML